jgi:Alr-MurF fusion protein
LGPAHDENFRSRSEKASEKIRLFENCDVVVYPRDIEEIHSAMQAIRTKKPLIQALTWGQAETAKFHIDKIDQSKGKSHILFTHRGTSHELMIPFADQASVENAMSCLCTLTAFERWDPEHIEVFKSLPVLENRMSFFEGKNGNYVVNDSYSNDTDSLLVALDFMLRQQPAMEHIAILSDLEQSDLDKEKLYSSVAGLLKEKGTQKVICVGSEMGKHKDLFQELNPVFFDTTAALLASGIVNEISQKAILVKGARSFQLEQVAEKLRKQLHQTVLEIDLNSLRNNYSYFREMVKPGTKMMVMVKAFGYGSGSFEAARTLQFMGADYMAVAYTDEGVALRQAGIVTPIMVMNPTVADVQALYEFQLEPVIFSREIGLAYASYGLDLNIHIEVDTGMHRLGFPIANLENKFHNFPSNLKVVSVFSHLSASENPEHDVFTRKQIVDFNEACIQIQNALGYPFMKHISNTGGILRFPEANLDMVRLGIGMYGSDPRGNSNQRLQPVASLKTRISQIHEIKAGESVGYSRKAMDNNDRRIATLPIGYADGLWRRLGNENGAALINGQLALYVGNICMDMCMCDVTHIPCSEGDEVEIFGRNMPVETLAAQCETIPYEILTGISQRVRREYLGEN